VRAQNLMRVCPIVVPIHRKNYYGFCDRLWIKSRYQNGELRDSALLQMIEEGVLSVPPVTLAYDLATWGTGELSLAAREERKRILCARPKMLDDARLIRRQTTNFGA
jgi:hypothetical protein